jgi:hypothetical protein
MKTRYEYQKARLDAMPPCSTQDCKGKVSNVTTQLCVNCYNRTPRGRDLQIRQQYGLRLGEFDELMSIQGGACGICESKVSIGRHGKENRLCVDHDHKTGLVRGLLCHRCNTALGKFFDDPKLLTRALMWLKQEELPDEKFNWIIEKEEK